MRPLLTLTFAVVLSTAGLRVAQAQLQNEDPTGTLPNFSGQTGQSENFSIQRDTNAFIGGSTTNFIGAQTTGGGAGLGPLGTASVLGGLGVFGGRGNTGLGSQATQQSAAEPQIRFRITLGFSHPRPTGTKISANFSQRLTRIPHLPSARSVAVTMEDRTAVLAGQVDSEREKRLIEKLAMMEPGVEAVRNELTLKAAEELLPLPAETN